MKHLNLELHPDMRVRKLSLGAEKAPLLVIDNFIADARALVTAAASQAFVRSGSFFPGIRAPAPPEYQQLISSHLRELLQNFFAVEGATLRFPMCHYSIVTTPPAKLHILQRIPHVDSLDPRGLASIHYLFTQSYGGTAFYRHRKTGFERIDEARKSAYYASLESENGGPNMPGPEYISGDTPLFEQIAKQEGLFNRLLIYRRNSLHSGCIDRGFVADPSPSTGRLSINSFIDFAA